MTIDKTIAAAVPADPDGDWTTFWQAITRPEPPPGPTVCRTCLDKGYYCSGGTTFRHCQCPRGEELRAGHVRGR